MEVSIDYITLPDVEGLNSVMNVIDKAPRMTLLIKCNRSVTTTQSARLYLKEIVKFHGILSILYSDRHIQFTMRF